MVQTIIGASLRRHHDRERHLDEFFVFSDGFQIAEDISTDRDRSALPDPKHQLHDGGLQCELVFVDLEQQGRVQVRVWHRETSVKWSRSIWKSDLCKGAKGWCWIRRTPGKGALL